MRKRPLIIFNARVPIIKVGVFSVAVIGWACCYATSGMTIVHPSVRIWGVPASSACWGSEPDPQSTALPSAAQMWAASTELTAHCSAPSLMSLSPPSGYL